MENAIKRVLLALDDDDIFSVATRDDFAEVIGLLRDVASSGVEIELRQYVTVQIGRKTWEALSPLRDTKDGA